MDRKHIVLIFVAYLIRDSNCQLAGLIDSSTSPGASSSDAGFVPFAAGTPNDPQKDASVHSSAIDLVVHDAPSAIGVISNSESQNPDSTFTFPDMPPLKPVPGIQTPDLQTHADPSQPTGAEISQLATELGIDLNFLTPDTDTSALQQAVDQAFPPVVIDIPAVRVTAGQSGTPDSATVSGDTTVSDASSKFPKIATDPVQASQSSDTFGSPFPVFDGPINPQEMSQMPDVSAVPVNSQDSAAFPAFEGVIDPVPADIPPVPASNQNAGGISVSLETGSSVADFPSAIGAISETQSIGSTGDAEAFPAFTGSIPDSTSGSSISDTEAFPAFTGTILDAPSSPSLSDNLSSSPRNLAAVTQIQEATAARRQVQQQVSANPSTPSSPFLLGFPGGIDSQAPAQQTNTPVAGAQASSQQSSPGFQSAGQVPPFGMLPGIMANPRLQQGVTQGNTGSRSRSPRLPGLSSAGQLPSFGMPPGMMSDPRFRFLPAALGQPQTPQAPSASTAQQDLQTGQRISGNAVGGLQSVLGQNAAQLQPTRQIIDSRQTGMASPFLPQFAGIPPLGFPGAPSRRRAGPAAQLPADAQNSQLTETTRTDPSILPRAEQVLREVQDLVNNLRSASRQQQPQSSSVSGRETCADGRAPVPCVTNPCEEVTCLNVLNARCRPRETCDECRPSFYVIERLNGIRSERDVSDICVTVNWNRPSGRRDGRGRPSDLPAPGRGERIPELTPLGTISARDPAVTRAPDGSVLLISRGTTPIGPVVGPRLIPPGLRRLLARGAIDPRIIEQQMQVDPRLTEAVLTGQINPALLDPRLRESALRERAIGIGRGPIPGPIMLPEIASQIRGERVVLPPEAQLALQRRLQNQGRPAIPTRTGQIATVRELQQGNAGLETSAAITVSDPGGAAARNELSQAFRQFSRQSRRRPVL